MREKDAYQENNSGLFEPEFLERLFNRLTKVGRPSVKVEIGQDVVERVDTNFHHWYSTGGGYRSKGVKWKVRQRLPMSEEFYLSTIFHFDNDRPELIQAYTCVVRPDESGREDYERIGDLRTDYFYRKGIFRKRYRHEAGVVDGNDSGFGLPTGLGHIEGNSFRGAITRAVNLVEYGFFGGPVVGEGEIAVARFLAALV